MLEIVGGEASGIQTLIISVIWNLAIVLHPLMFRKTEMQEDSHSTVEVDENGNFVFTECNSFKFDAKEGFIKID